jgi:hypothetical protein
LPHDLGRLAGALFDFAFEPVNLGSFPSDVGRLAGAFRPQLRDADFEVAEGARELGARPIAFGSDVYRCRVCFTASRQAPELLAINLNPPGIKLCDGLPRDGTGGMACCVLTEYWLLPNKTRKGRARHGL